ncbi:DNA-binding transcriptional LysR family regulator [Devosia subaequoris]|uniref:DNA-binding transcriptional LysR family regulator n=1 Tax=Devosia subaequoris TaxID=395930 RepID=A0A7W6ILB0_9HYPH|nr:LysR family transcriptional regulator [Devosia subaequoris]MBB4051708.1 DNA-binding transcriptional LysR family regulator [Devosia subaequoris]MCP1209294.1 LysR family transcriptional regulator [Devosia subaequoris]
MELRQLHHFVAAARMEHFTRAARKLNIAQSALSASIRSLEEELSAQLFLRTTRRVRLTAAGRTLLSKAEKVLFSVEEAREAVHAVEQGEAGRLTIGSVQSLPAFLQLPSILAKFHALYSKVEISLLQASALNLLDKLERGDLDIAFLPAFEARRGVETKMIACEELVLVCSRSAVLFSGHDVRLHDLCAVPFVDFETDLGTRTLIDRVFARALMDRRVIFEVSDLETLLNLVEQGLGVALVPYSVAHSRRDTLKSYAVSNVDLCWEIVVATRANTSRTASIARFLDQMPTDR